MDLLSAVSGASGFAGTVLIFFYGVPRQIDTGGRSRIVFGGTDLVEIAKINRYKRLGNLGLALVAVSFGLQTWAALSDQSRSQQRLTPPINQQAAIHCHSNQRTRSRSASD